MPGHDAGHPRLDRRPEGKQRLSEVARGGRKLEMRIDGRVAVAGKVLRTSGDAQALRTCDKGGNVPRDEARLRTERADADDRVPRIRVDVRNRGEVHRHADPRQLRGNRGRDALGQLSVVDGAQGEVARIGAAARSLQAGDIAASSSMATTSSSRSARNAAVSAAACERSATLSANSTIPPSPRPIQARAQSGASDPGKLAKMQAAAWRSSSAVTRGRRRP